MYGQPGTGNTPQERVLPTDWSTRSFVLPIEAPWSVSITANQLGKLILGFQPREMEDKWFVYSDGPAEGEKKMKVCFHRSWTGSKIAEIVVEVYETGKGGKATEIVLESNEDVIMGQDVDAAKRLVREVCRWCLAVNLGADEETGFVQKA